MIRDMQFDSFLISPESWGIYGIEERGKVKDGDYRFEVTKLDLNINDTVLHLGDLCNIWKDDNNFSLIFKAEDSQDEFWWAVATQLEEKDFLSVWTRRRWMLDLRN